MLFIFYLSFYLFKVAKFNLNYYYFKLQVLEFSLDNFHFILIVIQAVN